MCCIGWSEARIMVWMRDRFVIPLWCEGWSVSQRSIGWGLEQNNIILEHEYSETRISFWGWKINYTRLLTSSRCRGRKRWFVFHMLMLMLLWNVFTWSFLSLTDEAEVILPAAAFRLQSGSQSCPQKRRSSRIEVKVCTFTMLMPSCHTFVVDHESSLTEIQSLVTENVPSAGISPDVQVS